MRRISFFLGLSLFTLALAAAPEAHAGKKDDSAAEELPKIVPTGIAQFDDVFMKAKTIHDTLDTEDTNLKTARASINTALGVAQDAPLATALADLKTKASGKIKIAMKGTTPRLEPSEAVPENVQKGLDATNQLVDAAEHAITTGKDLSPQVQELVNAAKAFPQQLLTMGLDMKTLMDAKKKVADDVKAVTGTPARLDRLVKSCEGIFTDLKTVFAG